MPRSGCRHRSSASQDEILPSSRLTHRLIVGLEAAVADRLTQFELQAAPRLGARVHAGLEEAVGPASVALGAVQREVGVLQQLVEIDPSPGASAMPMLASVVIRCPMHSKGCLIADGFRSTSRVVSERSLIAV